MQIALVGDVARDSDGRVLELGIDLARHLIACIRLARRHHDFGAVLGQTMDNGLADALGGAGNNSNFTCQIKQRHQTSPYYGRILNLRIMPICILVSAPFC